MLCFSLSMRRMLRGLVVIVAMGGAVGSAGAALVLQDLGQGLSPTNLANVIVGSGVAISNVRQAGCPEMLGTFAGGTGIVGLESGLIMSSGWVAGAVGPNVLPGLSVPTCGAAGDPDLDALVQVSDVTLHTIDAAVLEFDFVPDADTVAFQYVFASEEYPEFVGSAYNDVFAFFVNGVNLALLPGTGQPVAVNNVNADVNGVLFVPNQPTPLLDTEADGLTQVLSFTAPVTPGQTNHIKLAIADTQDVAYDSWIFIGASSLSLTTTDVAFTVQGKTAVLDVDVGATGRGLGAAEAAGFARTDAGFASIAIPGAVTAPAGLTRVTKNVRRKINRKGRARLRLKLNRTGKRLLQQNGSVETLVVLRVTDREKRPVDFQRVITFRR